MQGSAPRSSCQKLLFKVFPPISMPTAVLKRTCLSQSSIYIFLLAHKKPGPTHLKLALKRPQQVSSSSTQPDLSLPRYAVSQSALEIELTLYQQTRVAPVPKRLHRLSCCAREMTQPAYIISPLSSFFFVVRTKKNVRHFFSFRLPGAEGPPRRRRQNISIQPSIRVQR